MYNAVGIADQVPERVLDIKVQWRLVEAQVACLLFRFPGRRLSFLGSKPSSERFAT